MAFRAGESEVNGRQKALDKLLPRVSDKVSAAEVARATRVLNDLIDKYGPVVDGYPSWHPFMTASDPKEWCPQVPGRESGFAGLDHTVYLANAIITCPYGDGKPVFESVAKLSPSLANISVTEIAAPLYAPPANPLLIACEWQVTLEHDGTVPARYVIPMLLEREVPNWRNAYFAESWESMRSQFLGLPCGSRSSLFVNQATGQQIKKVWNTLIETGMFGPTK